MKKSILFCLGFISFALYNCADTKTVVSKEMDINSKKVNLVNDAKETKANVQVSNSEEMSKNISQATLNKEAIANEKLRELHACYLAESPFKETLKMTKKERQSMGLPPNKYFEQDWEATMNPELGYPTFEKLQELRENLENERNEALALGRTPGDAADNNWVERGPTNVGGRTRAVIFDPNDSTNETVFAGGVSGGIWKNTNISNANSTWSRVNIPDHLNVSTLTVDPNNSSIFYAGTGESYVGGDVNGDGLWKSTDAGATWTRVFGGATGSSVFQSSSSVTINSPALGTIASIETTAFGVPITTAITSEIVLVNDGTALPNEGCGAFTNAAAVSGKIALIRRGTCSFIQKCTNATNAGAIAVIMINSVPGTPAGMGGTDTNGDVTIPSVAISKTDGDALVAALGSGAVNVTINPNNPGVITGSFVAGIQHINDVVIRNNAGTSEIYVAAAATGSAGASLGAFQFGLYRSINGGATWTEVSLPLNTNGHKYAPNNIEITAGNKVWLSTTGDYLYGEGGGSVLSSTDGLNFTLNYTVADSGDRTEIAVSKTNADKVYVLAQTASGVSIFKTTNSFATTSVIGLPTDVDSGIPANDFTRGQAFYDLLISTDPTNDEVVYIGGINLYKSINGAASWTQLSNWYAGLGPQEVHADQHGIAYGNGVGGNQKVLFGNDGGVYYSSNGGSLTTSRNKGFNVTQFYSLAVAPTNAVSGLTGDYFVAGAQDNGTQYFANAAASNAASVETQGGDGAFCMFDQGIDKYYISNYVYNANVNLRFTNGTVRNLNSEPLTSTNGAFIAPMVLDSNRDMVYSDYSTGTTYRIRRYSSIKAGAVVRTDLTNALLTGAPTAFAVSKYTTASTTLLVGTRNGRVLRLTTANTTPVWSDLSISAFVGTVSDIEFGASNDEIFVTMSNYGVTNIWFTSNGTAATPTWVSKEGNLPDIPVRCILQNPLLPTTEVIVGTDLGVWYTNNFNSTSPIWRQSYNGMRNVKVTDLDLRNDNTVFAATYGRGIFSGLFTNTVLNNETFENNKNVSIYPNPVKDVLNINVKDFSGDVSVKVIDINGREVFTQKISNVNNSNAINLSSLAAGIYVLKLQGENLNYSEKIILE
jgi:hypothetical protein